MVGLFCRRAIFIAHDSIIRKNLLKQIIQNFLLLFFWRIRVFSVEEKKILTRSLLNKKSIYVYPLAIDTELFKNYGGNRKDLIFLGNVTSDKNIFTILKALALVRKSLGDVRLAIVGEIRETSFWSWLKELGLQDSVDIIGFVPHKDLPKILNKYKVSLNSSISEGQCLAVYESLLCGCSICLPATASFVGNFNDCALFHAPFDSVVLSKNILNYLLDDNLREAHVTSGMDKIIHNYNSDVVTQMEMDLFSLI